MSNTLDRPDVVPTNLLGLPVLPEDRFSAGGTDIIKDAYKKELADVSSPAELKEFVSRWKNLYVIKNPNIEERTWPEEEKLALVDCDFDAVYPLLLRKKDNDLNFDDPNVRVMSQIAAPRALVDAFMLALQYKVGSDLAMVRLFLDPYPELKDKLL